MTTTPQQRRPRPSAQHTRAAAAGRARVTGGPARPAPLARRDTEYRYTFLGGPWVPGQSWLYPILVWGMVATAGFGSLYLNTPSWTYLAAGGATLLLTFAYWRGTGSTMTSVDREKVPLWHVGARLWFVGSVFAGGAWLTGITATGRSYTPPAAWSIAAASTLFVLTYPRVRFAQRRHEAWARATIAGLFNDVVEVELEVEEPEPEPTDPNADRWEEVFELAGLRGMTFIGERAGRSGPILHMRLPIDGSVTYDMVKGQAERIGLIFGHDLERCPDGLRPGAVRVQRATNKHNHVINTEVYVYIDVEDILAEIIWLSDVHTPMSIYKAFPVGKFADGTTIYLNLATIHAMIVGMTRSGKSNLLHVLLWQISRCFDAVIWMYDGKGGATASAWLQPWLDGEIDPTTGEPLTHPIIDWVAVDRFEVERQFLALGDIARSRPLIRRARGGGQADKWLATEDDPAIFYIADEVAESIGAHTGPKWASMQNGATSGDLGALLTSVFTLGAGEQVHVIASGQRGTVTMFGPGDGKAQIKGRIAFPLGSIGDGADVFQKSAEATRLLATLEHAGSVVVEGFGYSEPLPGKVFLAGTDKNLATRIRAAVIAHTPLRPELDAETERVANRYGYEDRWLDVDRTWWLRGHDAPPPTLKRFAGVGAAPTPGSIATLTRPSTVDGRPQPINPLGGGDLATPLDNPFARAFSGQADPLPELPAGGTGPVDDTTSLDQGEAEVWAAIEQQYNSERGREIVGALATGQLPPAAAGADDNDGYRRFVQIVDECGTHGCTMSAAWMTLGAEGLAPGVRQTLYTWRDKASRAGLIVQPVTGRGAPMYAKRHLAG